MGKHRIRKAWVITGDYWDDAATVYAPSRGKALYRFYVELDSSATFGEFVRRFRIERDHASDIRLPERHPLAAYINPEVLHCVVHAFGGARLKAGYRGHYYTDDRNPMPKAAYYHGLFEMHRVPSSFAGRHGMIRYVLTDLGRNVARGEAETYPRW